MVAVEEAAARTLQSFMRHLFGGMRDRVSQRGNRVLWPDIAGSCSP